MLIHLSGTGGAKQEKQLALAAAKRSQKLKPQIRIGKMSFPGLTF
jgi:hypothetical protein